MRHCLLFADGQHDTERILLTVLVQLVVIIVSARIFARLVRRFGQPVVVGEIVAGLVLGPSCLGHFLPGLSARIFNPEVNQVFGVFSQLGLILLLFVVGLEFDFSHLWVSGPAALRISASGIVVPFLLGLGLAWLMYPFLETAQQSVPLTGFMLFMGVAMSITAIPVLSRLMLELNITRTRLGTLTISAAALDDACGWILLAAITSIVQARFHLWASLAMVLEAIGFGLFMVAVARPLLKGYVGQAMRWGRGELGLGSFATVLVLVILASIATSLIGIFAIFGAFLMGTILSDEIEFRDAVQRRLRDFLLVFFLPIFFTYTGLRTNIGTLGSPVSALFLLAVLVCAVAGKLGGCGLAARVSGFVRREALCIGALMNARGLMELIVINVGRDLGVVPDSVYCMLVLMALATTMMSTPLVLRFMPGTELEPYIRQSALLAPRDKSPDLAGSESPTVVPNPGHPPQPME